MVLYSQNNGGKLGRLQSCTCKYYVRYGSGCKHMYYIAKQFHLLLVKNSIEYADVLILPPPSEFNTNSWVPDNFFGQENYQPQDQSGDIGGPGDTRPSKRQRPNNLQSGSHRADTTINTANTTINTSSGPTAEDTDYDKPLLTELELNKLLAQLLASKCVCPLIPCPIPGNGLFSNKCETQHHIVKLLASRLLALKYATLLRTVV